MAHLNKKLCTSDVFFFLQCLLLLLPCIHGLSFNYSTFRYNQEDIKMEEAAKYNGNAISLNNPSRDSVGRALYRKPMQLWDDNGKLADFTSNFSFQISRISNIQKGHGLTFVLVRENDVLSPASIGRLLGLFDSIPSAVNGGARNQVVAIEFDTAKQDWDDSDDHIGIDVNSIKSEKSTNVTGGFIDRGIANVRVAYNSTTRTLSASLTFTGDLKSYDVSYGVDLSIILPQRVQVGFTGATATNRENHDIYSWSFYSSLDTPQNPPQNQPQAPPQTPPQGQPQAPPRTPPPGGSKVALAVGIAVGLFVVSLITGVALYCKLRPRKDVDQPTDDQPLATESPYIEYLGPKKISYHEIFTATNNFDIELLLGEGGFGEVFEGTLPSSNEKVAVKKFSKGSGQGEKEYISEVSVISMLKHKNLVLFKGWCHENRQLILVYEYMHNRSLDLHLFGRHFPPLTWSTRYNIIADLASAIQYLQDGCAPYVLHRDIKSSNIMLDSEFNAKLGDFGLARLTQHDQKFKTTVPAGTVGYLAPEVLSSQKVSKASDIYSFGVVGLEVACGQRPIRQNKEGQLVKWVWELYGQGSILDAIDKRLKGEFDHDQARRLITVGLWCCHPDPEYRPSIRQVQAVLNKEATEPSLPPSIPILTYAFSNISTNTTEAVSSTRESNTTSSSTFHTS